MSPSQYYDEILAHQRKAELGGVHARLKEVLTGIKLRGQKKNRKARGWGDASDGSLSSKARVAFFSYNTVEATLLFCAVLVCLAGIMFESGQLDTDFYKAHRDLLTGLIIAVLFISVTYYVVVLVAELYIVCCPKKEVAKKMAKQASQNPEEMARQAALGKKQQHRNRRASALWRGISADTEVVQDAAVNPLFNRQQTKLSTGELEVFLSTEAVPAQEAWNAVRSRLLDM